MAAAKCLYSSLLILLQVRFTRTKGDDQKQGFDYSVASRLVATNVLLRRSHVTGAA
jgi:hypothetical protein